MIFQTEITLPVRAKGYHLITNQIIENLPELPEKGILNILLKHTSAAITINENVDPTVRQDFESFMSRLVPEGALYFKHTLEGEDDMPAHIKASIIGQSITIPITNHRLNLGTWQGIYLCEFRKHASHRQLVLTVYS
jgi:secondary thiamine-phosphate synthase enzyme